MFGNDRDVLKELIGYKLDRMSEDDLRGALISGYKAYHTFRKEDGKHKEHGWDYYRQKDSHKALRVAYENIEQHKDKPDTILQDFLGSDGRNHLFSLKNQVLQELFEVQNFSDNEAKLLVVMTKRMLNEDD